MNRHSLRLTALAVSLALGTALAADKPAGKSRSVSEIIEASTADDWRPLDPENTLYMELPSGRVVIELAPAFSPEHVVNLRTLVREKYFDGLAVIRSQDNYVVQWGDAEEDEAKAKPIGSAKAKLPPEFTVPLDPKVPFTRLPDKDGYAPEVGFSNGFPVGRNPKTRQMWLTHCYGAVGVGRGNEPDSGNGSSLYAITSHAPRHLDRNIAVVGRVVQGIERLSVMPRGPAPMGFYAQAEQRTPIASVRLAADVPENERSHLEVMRTDRPAFAAVAEARRNRHDDWYVAPAGYIELCNVPIPVRDRDAKK
ncbi:peptidylprolyl isomerase [Arenimonas oryziterrae]|uniref:peptidylprolyl isomerase n=1 Tax=Arenimonas oryziterrae DSM 21050 = YC6267 TaxID=1121015 RepID=A0A091AZW8_9GAMM|nr:peptidylprolyl isomerase [Arenimonas oryziterrae]KFN44852.1 hypothetical protein N789_02215 [Arenimonas oryziterrae DSM 21050 = YC6267]